MRRKIMLQSKKMRKAFTMIEALLAILIMILLFDIVANYEKKKSIENNFLDKDIFLQKFDKAIRISMQDIIEGYRPVLSNFDDGSNSWGWEANIKESSPFPTLTKKDDMLLVKYTLGQEGLSRDVFNNLRQTVIRHFISTDNKTGCHDVSDDMGSVEDIYLYCELIEDLKYDMSDGRTDLSSAYTIGEPLDPRAVPLAKLSYRLYDGLKTSYSVEEYHIPFSQEYNMLKSDSNDHLATIRNALEEFFNITMLREVANVENDDGSGGLNNSDDLAVGWYWKGFGDDRDTIETTYCDKASGSDSCENLNSNDIWRSGTDIKRGLIMGRLLANFLASDHTLALDGFGNAIYIHPNASSCDDDKLSECDIDAPPLPKDDYYLIGKPPYVSTLYITPYDERKDDSSFFGKIYITY